jgi:hypothetical protein
MSSLQQQTAAVFIHCEVAHTGCGSRGSCPSLLALLMMQICACKTPNVLLCALGRYENGHTLRETTNY